MSALRAEQELIFEDVNDTHSLAPPVRFKWDDEAKERLKKLWADGYSATEIACEFGDSVTRCAILGKVHRLGLPHRTTKVKRDSGRPRLVVPRKQETRPRMTKPRREALGIVKPPKFKPEPPKPPRSAWEAIDGMIPKQLVDLEHGDCRWPIGADHPYLFCGQPSPEGKSYCLAHAAMALNKNKQSLPVSEKQQSRGKPWGSVHGVARTLALGDW